MNNRLVPGHLYKMNQPIRFVTADFRNTIVISKNKCALFLYDLGFYGYGQQPFGPHFLFEKHIVHPYWESCCNKKIYNQLYKPL